jgi:hypothetical protein
LTVLVFFRSRKSDEFAERGSPRSSAVRVEPQVRGVL